jgi:hypothetical protein
VNISIFKWVHASAHSSEGILNITLNNWPQLKHLYRQRMLTGFGNLSSNTRLTVEILSCNTPDTGVWGDGMIFRPFSGETE